MPFKNRLKITCIDRFGYLWTRFLEVFLDATRHSRLERLAENGEANLTRFAYSMLIRSKAG